MNNIDEKDFITIEQTINFINNNTDLPKMSGIDEIYNLCCDLTSSYDESHDAKHHLDVYRNAVNIFLELKKSTSATTEEYTNIFKLITYASLVHDTIDHKYKKNLDEKIKRLNDFLEKKLSIDEYCNVKWIIDNISYSKEAKNGYPVHKDSWIQLARDIVSDADKLEALGTIGIERTKQFSRVLNPDANEEKIISLSVEHSHEKLLKLKDNYIRTKPGKILAEPAHQIIVDFVNKHS